MTRRPASMMRLAVWMPLALAILVGVTSVWLLHAMAELNEAGGSLASQVGDALLAADGKSASAEILAAYPPVVLLPLIALQTLTGLAGFGAANLFSGCMAALLAGVWLRGMLMAGFRPITATIMTLLLCLNPLFLRAVAEGPELMLTVWGAWIFAISAFAVRGRGGINDLMLCSCALMSLVFTGQSGILLAVATVPFLSLVMPADIRARSWLSVYLVLLFPVGFALLGFALINWMMLHDPLAFMRAQIEVSGEWFAGSWSRAAAVIVSAVAAAPILLGMVILARDRRPIQAVALALIGSVTVLALLTLQIGVGLSLAAALAPAIGLAAAAAMRWPAQERRGMRASLLLALGFLGGGSALLAERYAYTSGSEIREDRREAADRQVGRFLQGRADVLIDAAAHPQVVAARGSAVGLVTASETPFDLAMLRKRATGAASSVAVAAPDASRNADAIGRILPNFYAEGEPGYRLIYDRDGWRVWSRDSEGDET